MPSGIADGDLLIAAIVAGNPVGAGFPPATVPSGWQLDHDETESLTGAQDTRVILISKIADGTESGNSISYVNATSFERCHFTCHRESTGRIATRTVRFHGADLSTGVPATQTIATTGIAGQPDIYISFTAGQPTTLVPSGTLATNGVTLSPNNNARCVYEYWDIGETPVSRTIGSNDGGAWTSLVAAVYDLTIDDSVDGTFAATEGADTAALSGSVVVAGTMAPTEGADTSSMAARRGWSGTLAASEGADVAVVSGLVAWTGTLSATEGSDTAFFLSTSDVLGELAATEDGDAAALSGGVVVSGTAAAFEGSDAASFAGGVPLTAGALAATEGGDVAGLIGRIVVSGTIGATEGADAAAITGRVIVFGVLSATEGGDVAAFLGSVGLVTGTLAASEAPDVAAFSGIPAAVHLRRTVAAQHSTMPLLWLITIEHDALPYVVRWVNNPVAIVSRGMTFKGRAFKVDATGDGDETPSLRLTLSNHDRVIGKALESLEGFPKVTLERILAGYPDEPLFVFDDFTSSESRWDGSAVELTVTQDAAWNETYPLVRVTPRLFPGLFLS